MANSTARNEWYGWLKIIIVAIIVAFIIRTFIFSTSIVDGNSMYPTLEDGERVIINKFSYLVTNPHRGDIVIIEHDEKNYVKRVIGMPNETIEMKDYTLYIDGEALSSSYVSRDVEILTGNFGPIEIPEDYYFVMGDNRPVSLDSRHELGLIHRSEITGKSALIIYPFDNIELVR